MCCLSLPAVTTTLASEILAGRTVFSFFPLSLSVLYVYYCNDALYFFLSLRVKNEATFPPYCKHILQANLAHEKVDQVSADVSKNDFFLPKSKSSSSLPATLTGDNTSEGRKVPYVHFIRLPLVFYPRSHTFQLTHCYMVSLPLLFPLLIQYLSHPSPCTHFLLLLLLLLLLSLSLSPLLLPFPFVLSYALTFHLSHLCSCILKQVRSSLLMLLFTKHIHFHASATVIPPFLPPLSSKHERVQRREGKSAKRE